jgi:hypothetical protein
MAQAEEAFPGIARFFEALQPKPRTFLDLVAMFAFDRRGDRSRGSEAHRSR